MKKQDVFKNALTRLAEVKNITKPIISEKDQKNIYFKDIKKDFIYEE